MFKVKVGIISCCVFLAFLAPIFPAPPPTAADDTTTVLIIHSYDPEYRWTADINDGIMDKLAGMRRPHLICTEYLDWKRFPEQKNIDAQYSLFKEKYRNRKIDVIVTSDDKALEFAVKNRKELFSDAPIVFTGVYVESLAGLTGGARNITGVFEDQDITSTLKYAMRLQPALRQAYTISDLDSSGQAVEARIHRALGELNPDLPIQSLSALDIDSIEKFVSKLTMQDLVVIGSYSIDRTGKTFTGEELIGRVGLASKTPVWVLNTHHLGTGAFGGKLLSPKLLGENAGLLAERILQGAPADSLQPISDRSTVPMFDYNAIQRLRISIADLPLNSEYINREIPLIVQYKNELIAIALFFFVLLVLLDIVFINYRQAQRLAKDLAERNDEITLLNDSLSQSEEELRQQYNELAVTEENLEASEERFRLAAIGSNDAIWDWNYLTKQTHYSDRWYEMLGFSRENDGPISVEDVIHPDDLERYKNELAAHVKGETDHFMCEIRVKTADGAWKWIQGRGKGIWDNNKRFVRFAGSITDIDDRKHKEEEIENLAFYDQLTGLPNRRQAIEMTRREIAEADEDAKCGIIFIDIDNFKYINDTFGHTVGDKILAQIAQTLSSLLNENLSIARFGGDEFIMLVANTTAAEMEKYARLILTLLGRKMNIDGRYHFLTVSAGLALCPDQAIDFEGLFQKADAALHRAKIAGKTRFVFYNTGIQQELVNRMELESGLRTAIDNGEIFVAYQPQIDLKTGRIAGLEALARWNNPRKGFINPGEFIPIAEESGQIDKIGIFVLRAAAKFIKRAETFGNSDFTVSVNVSVRQMQETDFVPKIIRVLEEEDVPPGKIALEITESFMIDALDPIITKLNDLKTAGFMLSLDDFGKGYSSLSYLRSLPVNYIKIDKTFIDDILSTTPGIPLARTIIELSHQLGLKVVAEGVEVAEQITYLKENGCDLIQGFYYSKPGTEDTVLGQLKLSFD